MLLRTVENAMPAITTELEWTIQDLLKFMIQNGKFVDINGTISEARVDAAQEFLKFDWHQYEIERFRSKNFDPERPQLDILQPEWKNNIQIQTDLAVYLSMKAHLEEIKNIIKSGPNDEYRKAENSLLMCQRVDLWCAGPKEVERAVIHLYKLGRALNEREVDMPMYIADFIPGVDDMADI